MSWKKPQARALAKEYIQSIRSQEISSFSQKLENILSESLSSKKELYKLKKIALYRADSWEIPIQGLIEKFPDIKFYFPKVKGDNLQFIHSKSFQKGSFGIWEPEGSDSLAIEKLDLALIPGLGFGTKGHRLGRGKGFYDRYFKDFPKSRIWGIGFHENSFLNFEWQEHDISVGSLFTEKGEFSFLD